MTYILSLIQNRVKNMLVRLPLVLVIGAHPRVKILDSWLSNYVDVT